MIKPFQKQKIPEGKRILVISDMEYEDRLYRMEFLLNGNRQTEAIMAEPLGSGISIGNLYSARIDRVLEHPHGAFLTLLSGSDPEEGKAYLPIRKSMPLFYTEKHSKREFRDGEGLSEGDSLLVMVEKGAVREKEPMATTSFTLESPHLIYEFGRTGLHCSRKLRKEQKREFLQRAEAAGLLPEGGSITLRSNARGLDIGFLAQELASFEDKIQRFLTRAKYKAGPCLLQEAVPHYIEEYRHNRAEFDYIRTDDRKVYEALLQEENAEKNAEAGTERDGLCESKRCIDYYEDRFSLKNLYSLSARLDRALHRKVYLKSGANLVIEKTEAFYIIDVNSGKALNRNILSINLEAAEACAREIRLRNLSGIILIDFLKLREEEDQKQLTVALEQAVAPDPVPVHVYGLTALGIMELTREKHYPSLQEQLTS